MDAGQNLLTRLTHATKFGYAVSLTIHAPQGESYVTVSRDGRCARLSRKFPDWHGDVSLHLSDIADDVGGAQRDCARQVAGIRLIAALRAESFSLAVLGRCLEGLGGPGDVPVYHFLAEAVGRGDITAEQANEFQRAREASWIHPPLEGQG